MTNAELQRLHDLRAAGKELSVPEIKALLRECENFIRNAESDKRELEQNLMEIQEDYREVCDELSEINEEYRSEQKEAQAKGYGAAQMETLHRVFQDNIKTFEEEKKELEQLLNNTKRQIAEYPENLKSAIADKEELERELMWKDGSMERSMTNGPGKMIGGAIIWFVIISVIVKACGG